MFQKTVKWVLPPQVGKREPDVGGSVAQRKERCLCCPGEPVDVRVRGNKALMLPTPVSTRPQVGSLPLALLSLPLPPNFTPWLRPARMTIQQVTIP